LQTMRAEATPAVATSAPVPMSAAMATVEIIFLEIM
jgi:hypothetical protein